MVAPVALTIRLALYSKNLNRFLDLSGSLPKGMRVGQVAWIDFDNCGALVEMTREGPRVIETVDGLTPPEHV